MLTNWSLTIPNWSKVNVNARYHSSVGRISAPDKDGGTLRKYLYKAVFQSAKWADPAIQYSTRAVTVSLTNRDGLSLIRALHYRPVRKTPIIFVGQLLPVLRGKIPGESCTEM